MKANRVRNLSKYRAVNRGLHDSCVERITVCVQGHEDDPRVESEGIVWQGYGPGVCTSLAGLLNVAFNEGREVAKQR